MDKLQEWQVVLGHSGDALCGGQYMGAQGGKGTACRRSIIWAVSKNLLECPLTSSRDMEESRLGTEPQASLPLAPSGNPHPGEATRC